MWSLLVLSRVLSGYLGFLTHSKDMHIRLTGDSKLPVDVNKATCSGCTVPSLLPYDRAKGWDRVQHPCKPKLDKQLKTWTDE